MGCMFSRYLITYLSMCFCWKPSPANCGSGHYSSAAVCGLFQAAGAAYAPYQYVGDGAFVEHWMGAMPWQSVELWEQALTRCFGISALHRRKKEVDGKCDTRIALWGIDADTGEGTFALPQVKRERSRVPGFPGLRPGKYADSSKTLAGAAWEDGALGPVQCCHQARAGSG